MDIETRESNVLTRVDEFEDKIILIQRLSKQYDELKKEIKEEMVAIGKELNADQLKWTTNSGIKITLSIGKPAEFEEREVEEFSLVKLKEEYPEIYDSCMVKKTKQVAIKNSSYDRLVITLPKEEENE